MNRGIVDSSYEVEFHGPSFECKPPPDIINEAITMALNASEYLVSAQTLSKDHYASCRLSGGKKQLSNHSATFLDFAASCIITEPPTLETIKVPKRTDLCYEISYPQGGNVTLERASTTTRPPGNDVFGGSPVDGSNLHNYGQLWIWAQNETLKRVLTDTLYKVRLTYSPSENAQRVDPKYAFNWTEENLKGTYFPVADAVANILTGSLRDNLLGLRSFKTRMTNTMLLGALKTRAIGGNTTQGILESLTPSDIKKLAENKTIKKLVEELSRNVTLSLFGAEEVLDPAGANATVIINSQVNVYSYSQSSLLITYGITFALSLVGALVGRSAYYQNGVSHNITFSAFMSTTRNPGLDRLTEGHSMGTMPLVESVKNAELQVRVVAW
ncbi:hypothetical protein OQA88_187 [Cercophora sp. LCS_1]